jgi:hypothetical protein
MIVRLLAFAVAVVLVTAPGSSLPVAAQTPKLLGSIPLAQRLTLPPSTMVRLADGRIVSIATLMAEHTARLQRFGNARSLATRLQLSHPFVIGSQKLRFTGGTPASAPAPAPSASAAGAGLPLVKRTFNSIRWAGDYNAFCNAAQATACLYYPAGVPLEINNGAVSDADYLVGQTTCTEEGGQAFSGGAPSVYWGCLFIYPLSDQYSFFPGVPSNMQVVQACPAPFVADIDPHGAIALSSTMTTIHFTPSATMSCVVQAYAPAP